MRLWEKAEEKKRLPEWEKGRWLCWEGSWWHSNKTDFINVETELMSRDDWEVVEERYRLVNPDAVAIVAKLPECDMMRIARDHQRLVKVAEAAREYVSRSVGLEHDLESALRDVGMKP